MRHYFYEINLLRGFTILLIVYEHVCGNILFNPGIGKTTSWTHILDFLFSVAGGASWFFVFISGFLFYPIFVKNGFLYKQFMQKKLTNVILPYLVFVILYIFANIFLNKITINTNFIITSFYFGPLWYIPFIFTIFLFSNFFIYFIDSSKIVKIFIMILFIISSIIFTRCNFNPLIQCCHFTCAYLLGILCSLNYDKLTSYSINAKVSLIYITVLFINILICLNLHFEFTGEDRWSISLFNPLSWISLVKLSYCIIFFWLAHALLKVNNKFTNYIKSILNCFAKYSFSIYFMHMLPILFIVSPACIPFWKIFSFWQLFIICAFLSFFICLIAAMFSKILKLILGKYSRMFIGS